MIAYEHWPQMPSDWRDLDADLNARLAASPVVSPDDFTFREQRCVALASEDNNRNDVAGLLFLNPGTVKTHWENAGNTLKGYLADSKDVALKAEANSPMYLHRLVYVLLDNEVIPMGTKIPRTRLDTEEAIYLKGLATGATSDQAGELVGAKRWKVTHELLPPLKEKLGAFTLPGIVSNAYRMEFFIPRTSTRPLSEG